METFKAFLKVNARALLRSLRGFIGVLNNRFGADIVRTLSIAIIIFIILILVIRFFTRKGKSIEPEEVEYQEVEENRGGEEEPVKEKERIYRELKFREQERGQEDLRRAILKGRIYPAIQSSMRNKYFIFASFFIYYALFPRSLHYNADLLSDTI